MGKKKTSRRALLTSVMALVMCLVMLVGTTFAWFTDSVTSGVNTIKSGNLDVALAYEKAKNEFADVTESTRLFDDAALWEPGHVEYTVLKVSNVGSLALRYQLGINVAGEVGSTNVLDQAFQLSTYLRYAVLEGDKCGLTRDKMLEAAGDGKQLASYTGAETTLLPAAADTVTVVVWMPTTVGNEANHKTGVAAPSIKLGVNLVATQTPYENDSFGSDYDKDANGNPDHPEWNVSADVTGTMPATGDAVLKNADGTAVVTIPGGAAEPNAALSLKVVPTTAPAGVTVSSGQASRAYDVEVTGLKEGNTTPVEVKLFVGKNLTGVTVYHNDAEMAADAYSYDTATGFVTIRSTTFSPFTIVYEAPEAMLGGAYYKTLAAAIDAAQAGDTVTMVRDVTINSGYAIEKSINLNGGQYDLTVNGQLKLLAADYRVSNITIKSSRPVYVQNATAAFESTVVIDSAVDGNAAMWVYGNSDVKFCGTVNAPKAYGVCVNTDQVTNYAPNTVLLSGATVYSGGPAFYVNGSFGGHKGEILNSTLTSIDAKTQTVYVSGQLGKGQTLTIKDSVITGATAVEVKHSDVTLTNTVMNATGDPTEYAENNNGGTAIGYCFATTSNSNNGTIDPTSGTITIDGCTFKPVVAGCEVFNSYADAEGSKGATINGYDESRILYPAKLVP